MRLLTMAETVVKNCGSRLIVHFGDHFSVHQTTLARPGAIRKPTTSSFLKAATFLSNKFGKSPRVTLAKTILCIVESSRLHYLNQPTPERHGRSSADYSITRIGRSGCPAAADFACTRSFPIHPIRIECG